MRGLPHAPVAYVTSGETRKEGRSEAFDCRSRFLKESGESQAWEKKKRGKDSDP